MAPILLLLSVLAADPSSADAWPGFRGDGTSVTTAGALPLKWSPTENIAWRIPLAGYGQSSPVVWKDRVFVTSVEGPDKERLHVLAFDLASGRKLWSKEFAASQRGKNQTSQSRAAATPVVDANGLYVFFESGDLVGLSHDGDVKWQRSLVKDYGALKTNHGLGGSLVQAETNVIVLIAHDGPSYLLAVDKVTGQNAWKTDRAEGTSWTTPVVATQNGKAMILVSSAGSLAAYDAIDGREAWTLTGLSGNTVPSPVVAGDRVIVGASSGRASAGMEAVNSNCCVQLSTKEGKAGYDVVWEAKKVGLSFASPIVHRGLVYMLGKAGVLYCLDLETGEEKYVQRLNNCWATPVAAGDYIYFFGKDGSTIVIEAGPEFKQVAANPLFSAADLAKQKAEAEKAKEDAKAKEAEQPKAAPPAGAPPAAGPPQRPGMDSVLIEGEVVYGVAVVEGTIVIRTGTEMYCIRAAK